MKKLIGLMLVVMLAVALLGCEEMVENKPLEPNVPVEVPEEPVEEEPVEDEQEEPVEDEPVEEEPEEETPEDTVTLYESSGEKGVWKTLELDTEGYNTLIITIKGDYAHDIPVNFDNWKVNNELVTYEGLTGNKYQVNKDITIGGLPTVVTLVNLRQNQIGLHTVATASTPEGHEDKHFIRVDVSTVNTFGFDFTVTTAAFAHIDGLQIELSK